MKRFFLILAISLVLLAAMAGITLVAEGILYLAELHDVKGIVVLVIMGACVVAISWIISENFQ